MRHLLALTLVLLASTADAQTLKGSAMHGSVTQQATIGGIHNGIRVALTVTHFTEGTTQRTWLMYDIFDTPAGGTEPTHLRTRISQQIADADLQIGPHSSILHTIVSDGTPLDITWTLSDALHLQYDASWRTTTNGSVLKRDESSDTRSAMLLGTLAGIDLAPRSGQVITTTSQESTH